MRFIEVINMNYTDSTEAFIFVDFENLPRIKIERLDPHKHELFIFVGHKQNRIHFDLVQEAQQFGEHLHWIKIKSVSKNNLDFHLCFVMGELHQQVPASIKFYVLSKDKGFDPVLRFVRNKGRKCRRLESMKSLYRAKTKKPKEKNSPKPKENANNKGKADLKVSKNPKNSPLKDKPKVSQSATEVLQRLRDMRPVKRPRRLRTLRNFVEHLQQQGVCPEGNSEELLQQVTASKYLKVEGQKVGYAFAPLDKRRAK